MNAQRTLRIAALLFVAAALISTGLISALSSPAAAYRHGTLGQALALRALLHSPLVGQAGQVRIAGDPHHSANGRYLPSLANLRLRANAAPVVAGPALIDEGVQTFDVFNPPPGFVPTQGPNLTPTNLEPVWTADGSYLIFSSNRDASGNPGVRFHIWAIPINGGIPVQITTSAGPTNGGEFYPTLSAGGNNALAFTSDAQTPGVQNLFGIGFNIQGISAGQAAVDVATLPSPTIRIDPTARQAGGTGFGNVLRPTFSSANSDLLVFSALSTAGTYQGHYHLYFLYVSTGGFNASGGPNSSLPAKMTDGPADDTDPAFSPDSQLLAFASTASSFSATGAGFTGSSGNAPNGAPLTSGPPNAAPGSLRHLFLLGGGIRFGFGTLPNGSGAPTTNAGTDDMAPAWSSLNRSRLNQAPGQEYLAFARGATQSGPHDIYYLQILSNIDAGGESGRSNEFSTTPLSSGTATNPNPLYQINAGGDTAAPYQKDNFFAGGTANGIPNPAPAIDTTQVPRPAPQAVYQTNRTTTSKYVLPSLTPGAPYRVRLHFAELAKNPGERKFDIFINGTRVIQNYDIAAAAGGKNIATTLTFNATASTFSQQNRDGTSVNKGAVTIDFKKGAADEPLISGIELFVSRSGGAVGSGFGADTGTPAPAAPTINSVLATDAGGGAPRITIDFSNIGAVSYNLFRSTRPGGEGLTPIATGLTSTPFTDTNVSLGTTYFYQVSAIFQETLSGESGGNLAVKLNTDDNAGETTAAGNAFDDRYPTWSPLAANLSIAYQSNRSVTYNDPATATPVETAISLGAGAPIGQGGTVGTNYVGLLESQVVNLDPPTLLRFSSTEVVHVADASGTQVRSGIAPGQPLTFTVRLSNREAGIDNTNGPNTNSGATAGNNPSVFLQIKDPDSKYQDAQGLEHKVFAKDFQFQFQANNPFGPFSSSGSEDRLMNGGGFQGFNNIGGNMPRQRGSVGGVDGGDTISVGRNGGGTNPINMDDNGNRFNDPNGNPFALPGGDPSLFIPWGPEYECQVVNPQFGVNGPDTVLSDYRNPFYVAGLDDQGAGSGFGTQRPATEWLQFTKSPTQDKLGGVLYTVTWTTPTSGSDYYLDVIAYDNASNFRIYDNVWGFSTAGSIGNNDILVVNDNALGQKFAASSFGGDSGLSNLVPKLYGAESYVTDVDVNILPNAIYRRFAVPGRQAVAAEVLPLNTRFFGVLNGLGVGSYNDGFTEDGSRTDGVPNPVSQRYSLWRILARGPVPTSVLNSYAPTFATQPAVVDAQNPDKTFANLPSANVPVARRCVIWLSPFTGDLLVGPGALDDPNTQQNLRAFVAAGGRLCISGQDIASTLTQNGNIDNGPGSFLNDVLKAKLTTPDQGSQILSSSGGTQNRISGVALYDNQVREAFTQLLSVDLSNGVFVFAYQPPNTNPLLVSNNYGANDFNAPGFNYNAGPLPNWRADASLDQLGSYPTSFSTAGTSVLGKIDTITPVSAPNVHVDLTSQKFTAPTADTQFATRAGGIGMIYNEDFTSAPGSGFGSRVVYSTFGLEGLSTEYYAVPASNGVAVRDPDKAYAPRNQRQKILHNIVTYLRTSTFTGTIRQTTSGGGVGAGLSGATVYLVSATGIPIPGPRNTFSATTDQAGNYRIDGVEAGTYTVAAYKNGFVRGASNAGVTFTVEGDTSQQANLTLAPLPPGTISGIVTDNATPGNPVANAAVSFASTDGSTVSGTTAADGTYKIINVPPGTYTGTATKSPQFSDSASQQVTVTGNANSTANFVLTPVAPVVSGRVTDTSNADPTTNGIGGATVTFTPSGGGTALTATTAATGAYSITLPLGTFNAGTGTFNSTTYTAVATAPRFQASAAATVTVNLGDRMTQNFALNPTPKGTLTGTVHRNADTGPGLAGATVTLTPVGGGKPLTAITDANGVYTIAGVFAGTYTVAATETNFVQTSPPPAPVTQVTIVGNRTTTQDFTLRSTLGTVTGTVTDATLKTPLQGVTITITDPATGNPIPTTPATVTTDANGNYSVTLKTGTYTATATLATYNTLTASVNVPDGDATLTPPLNFALVYQFGMITGLVSSKTTGQPLAGATITVVNPTTNATVATLTSTATAGANFISGLIPTGTYNVTVTLANFTTQTATGIVVTPHGTTTVPPFVLVSALGTVGGRVTDSSTGLSLTGATITLTNTATNVTTTLTSSADATLVDGKIGNYLSQPLLAGVYNVTVSLAGFNPVPLTAASPAQTVTIPNGDGFVRADFALVSTTGTLVGLVSDVVTGAPIAGATLTLTDPTTGNLVATFPSKGTTTTGPDGKPINYSGSVLQGTYTLTVTRSSFTSPMAIPVTITGGTFTRKDFPLRSTIGRLGGLVTTFAGSAPVGGVTITATNTTTGSVTTFSTSAIPTTPPVGPLGDGQPINYSGSLPAGTYTVVASKSGFTSITQTVTVTGDAFVRLDFTGTKALPALHQFPQGLNFFSAPYDFSGLSFDALLGPLNTAPRGTASNGTRSHVAVWNPQINQYALDPTPPADALRLGIGYWVYLYQPANLTQTGPIPTDATVAVTLHPLWNQIGVPSLTPINVSDLVFSGAGSGTRLTFAQATSTSYHLISPTLYRFDGVGYQPVGPGDTLQPYQAYWIKTFADSTIFIPTRPVVTTPTPPTSPTPPTAP